MKAVRNIYIVFGWRVSEAIRNSMMMEKGEEARQTGITLTVSGDGKHSFLGHHVGTLEMKEGHEYASLPVPGDDERNALQEKIELLGFDLDDPPILYVVAG